MGNILGSIFGLLIGAFILFCWLTHIVYCLTVGAWGFLIA
jgi:hypothetical protein